MSNSFREATCFSLRPPRGCGRSPRAGRTAGQPIGSTFSRKASPTRAPGRFSRESWKRPKELGGFATPIAIGDEQSSVFVAGNGTARAPPKRQPWPSAGSPRRPRARFSCREFSTTAIRPERPASGRPCSPKTLRWPRLKNTAIRCPTRQPSGWPATVVSARPCTACRAQFPAATCPISGGRSGLTPREAGPNWSCSPAPARRTIRRA